MLSRHCFYSHGGPHIRINVKNIAKKKVNKHLILIRLSIKQYNKMESKKLPIIGQIMDTILK
jgi:hypothetical protein